MGITRPCLRMPSPAARRIALVALVWAGALAFAVTTAGRAGAAGWRWGIPQTPLHMDKTATTPTPPPPVVHKPKPIFHFDPPRIRLTDQAVTQGSAAVAVPRRASAVRDASSSTNRSTLIVLIVAGLAALLTLATVWARVVRHRRLSERLQADAYSARNLVYRDQALEWSYERLPQLDNTWRGLLVDLAARARRVGHSRRSV